MSPPSQRDASCPSGKKDRDTPGASSSANQGRSRTAESLRSSSSSSTIARRRRSSTRERKEGKRSGSPERLNRPKSAAQERASSRRQVAAGACGASTVVATPTTKPKQSAPLAGRSINNNRNTAAVRVQALFRGHKGRACAAGEHRKQARRRVADREAEEEQRRPRAAASRRLGGRILRPKVASTYGF